MGYLNITNIETGECELEIGVRPETQEQDGVVCEHSGITFSSKPKAVYREYMKEGFND